MADTYTCVKVVLETCTWAVICPGTLIWVIIDPFPVRAVWLVLPVAESANHFRANHPTVVICQVTKSKSREEEPAATAAGPSNSVPEEGPADPLRCDLCGLLILRPIEKRAAPILHELSWDARSGERFSRFNRRECLSRSEGLVRESL